MKIGTRGIIGFRTNNQDKLTYNHWDSYPQELGVQILEEVSELSLDRLKEIAEKIIFVDDHQKPTKKQIEECKKWADTRVSTQTLEEWYCLLRKAQGTLAPYIRGELRFMRNSQEFIKDSLFCEWGYIINLDTKKLEVWQGFQNEPQKGNRYGETPNKEGYYPCALIKEYYLHDLPDKKTFLKEVDVQDEE